MKPITCITFNWQKISIIPVENARKPDKDGLLGDLQKRKGISVRVDNWEIRLHKPLGDAKNVLKELLLPCRLFSLSNAGRYPAGD